MGRVTEQGEKKPRKPRTPSKPKTAPLDTQDLKELSEVAGLRPEPPTQADAAVMETTTKTTKKVYREPKPKAQANSSQDELEDLEIIDDEPIDPFTQMLTSMDEDGEVKCRIKRLPDPPNMRGRFRDTCMSEVSYGELVIQNPGNYEAEIRDFCGSGGKYRIQLTDRGKILKTVDKIIGDLARPPAQIYNGQAPSQGMQLYQQPLTPVDPLTQLMNNAKQLADLKTVFRTLSGDDDRKEAIVTAPAPTKETFIAELIMQSPDARKQMVSTLFGGLLGDGSAAAKEEKIPWYGRMLMSIAENPDVMRVAAPAVMGVVGMLVNKFGFNKPTTPPSAQPPGATIYPQVMTTDYPIPPQGDIHAPQGSTMPAGDVVAPTTTDLGDGEESEDTAPQMTLFELVLNSVLDNLYKQVPITDFKWLETLETQFPSEVAQMKTMLNTLPLPVLMAIISSYGPDYADAMQLPHAAAYLEVLVNQIKERENKRNEHSTSDSVDKSTVGGSGS